MIQSDAILVNAFVLISVGGVVGSRWYSFTYVQSENALLPMLVTPSGIVIDARLEQSENARSPMLVLSLIHISEPTRP